MCERNGHTSRKAIRGAIGSLAVISSTHTRWIGITGGRSQASGDDGVRPCREPFTSNRTAKIFAVSSVVDHRYVWYVVFVISKAASFFQSSGDVTWWASGTLEPKSVRYELCVWFVVNVRARNVTVPMPFVRGGHCTKELFS